MKQKAFTTAIAGCALLSISCLASAQRSVTYSTDGRPNRIFHPANGLNPSDSDFLTKAACINMFEIEAAKIAQDRGESPFTKEYAKEMMAEHQGSFDEVKQVAGQKNVTLPTDLPIEQQRTINYLSKLNGADFDEAYRRTQINGHSMASSVFKDEVDNGHDEDVKAYAVKTLPGVTMHYKMAKAGVTMMGPTKADHGI